MKGRPIDQLVYEQMFPKPRAQDPQNFHALLQRHLILEVRQEVHSFYGHLDTPEAKYPGLDYNNRTHRIRLGRWQWHRRLFRALDALRLTPNEISALTKWEGTKWAKERYEREQHCNIHDTAMDHMFENESRRQARVLNPWPTSSSSRITPSAAVAAAADDCIREATDASASDTDDGELESVGISLNERLQERLAARDAGNSSLPLDDAFEQWFKNATETGQIDAARERMLVDARAGNWHEVPEVLQNVIRDALLAEHRQARARAAAGSPSSSTPNPLTPSQVGILSAPLPAVIPPPQNTRASTSRSSYTGLRIPGAFEGVDDGGTTPHVPRTNA